MVEKWHDGKYTNKACLETTYNRSSSGAKLRTPPDPSARISGLMSGLWVLWVPGVGVETAAHSGRPEQQGQG
jgi:hypothetical protein